MSQYLIRKGKLVHEVTKFDDSDTPLGVYTISGRGCDCPARSRNCKHSRIKKAWETNGSLLGEVYDDSIKVIGYIFS